jgi:hypothetical protein
MGGGQQMGGMFKAKGGGTGRSKKANGGVPDVYTSSRPTDKYGNTMTNEDLHLGYAKDTRPAPKPAPKPVMRGKAASVADTLAGSRNMRKHGGKAWEGSAKDEAQDKKLAKKYGMSMSAWEKSKMDKKHDTQHSAKGLNKGGRTGKSLGGVLKDVGKYGALGIAANEVIKNPSLLMGGLGALAYKAFDKKKGGAPAAGPAVAGKKRGGRLTSLDGEMQTQEKVGGRIAKQYGGSLGALEMNSGGRTKKKNGKTDINITIMTGKGQPPMDPNMQQPPMPQGVPVQMPPPPQPQARLQH